MLSGFELYPRWAPLVFVRRNVGSARTVTLPSQKGEPAARWVTLLAKPTFFHIYTVRHVFLTV